MEVGHLTNIILKGKCDFGYVRGKLGREWELYQVANRKIS